MNVLLGKTSSIKFSDTPDFSPMWGGYDFMAITFIRMAEMYPQHTFYYFGTGKWKEDIIPLNLIDLHTIIRQHTTKRSTGDPWPHYADAINYLKENNYHFDVAIINYTGNHVPFWEYDKGYISPRKGTPRKLLSVDKTISRILGIAKSLDIPTYYILDDIRQIHCLPSDTQKPIKILSQFNGTDKSEYYTGEDLITKEVCESKIEYRPIQTMPMFTKEYIDWRGVKKDKDFMLTVNGAGGRFKLIKEWILNYMPDTPVYGDWTHNKAQWTEICNSGFKDNFIPKAIVDMKDDMLRSKYTFIIPSTVDNKKDETYKKFVTTKPYVMLEYGIIPFYSPKIYDADNLLSDFPDYIKVQSPEELYAKIQELNNNPQMYQELLDKMWELNRPEYYNGEILHEIFDDILNK